jgi:hypothetical protein
MILKHLNLLSLIIAVYKSAPKREEVAEDWRRLQSEELHNLYASPNIIRMIETRRISLSRHAARMGELKNMRKILVGKT